MTTSSWTEVGVLERCIRYPLKGAAGQDLERCKVGWHGLSFDRRYAWLRNNDLSGLPWVSPRQFPQVVSWSASIDTAGDLVVVLPGSSTFTVSERDREARARAGEAATDLLGEPVTLMPLWSGTHDAMPIGLLTTATVEAASLLVDGLQPDHRRFRPNLLIATTDNTPWIERKWIGRDIRIGDGADAVVLRVDRATTRCEVVDISPDTGIGTHQLFDAIRSAQKNRAGCYCTPVHIGQVHLGDKVHIR